MRYIILLISILAYSSVSSQTWIDSLDNFARNSFLPPQQYFWTWRNAPLLHAMEFQYELASEENKGAYLDYVKIAMDRNLLWANGVAPNSVASGNGMAFLYRITEEQKYKQSANKVYREYLEILRTNNGGVSHLAWTPELWDDTIYMIGVHLLAMFRATGDEKYITELIDQIKFHKEKLQDETWGLWVHGWDGNGTFTWDFCSDIGWPDVTTRKSHEFWGRANGWVVVTLSELLNNINEDHEEWDFIAETLAEMIQNLPSLQDESTGHWYQLPVRKGEPGNFIESSCSAMFGYGILTALKHGVVVGEAFENAVHLVYYGLKKYSTFEIENNDNGYLNTKNVCSETCIGDKEYYFNIEVVEGRAYALAMFIIFGRTYEMTYLNNVSTDVIDNLQDIQTLEIYPTFIENYQPLNISINAISNHSIKLEIMDIMGRIIYAQTELIGIGKNRSTIRINNLYSGEYFLSLKDINGQLLESKPFFVL